MVAPIMPRPLASVKIVPAKPTVVMADRNIYQNFTWPSRTSRMSAHFSCVLCVYTIRP